MMKAILLTGATLLVATPAAAQVAPNVTYNNALTTTVTNNNTTNSNLSIGGGISVNGNVEIDSQAGATIDGKQIITGNIVRYGNVDSDDDDAIADNGVARNTVEAFDVTATGNAGVNVASGYYNVQSNDTAISSSSSDSPNGDDGSWANANTTNWQSLGGTYYGNNSGSDSYRDRNTANVGTVAGSGNIGVNAAAGAFNLQSNKMAIATAFDTSLANATSGSIQQVAGNLISLQNSNNTSDIGTVGGTGNVAVNVASGVGNLQSNSLTIASAR